MLKRKMIEWSSTKPMMSYSNICFDSCSIRDESVCLWIQDKILKDV